MQMSMGTNKLQLGCSLFRRACVGFSAGSDFQQITVLKAGVKDPKHVFMVFFWGGGLFGKLII